MFKKIWVGMASVAIASTSVLAQPQPGGSLYQDLIQILECPNDLSSYGDYHDYGYWAEGTWCGKSVPAGYLVYSYPNWYIWASEIPPSASAYGSYGGLLQVLSCPKDLPEYGSYYDAGYGDNRRWCNTYAAEGYRVYLYPDWYIWSYSNR